VWACFRVAGCVDDRQDRDTRAVGGAHVPISPIITRAAPGTEPASPSVTSASKEIT
jgi:hypothetical protein